jgi:dTDP-glucose 4,6-dehydratase
MKTLLVTGGCGFIGSAVVRQIIARTPHAVVNVDKMTYAATEASVASVAGDPRYRFEPVDICDASEMARVFAAHRRPASSIWPPRPTWTDQSTARPPSFRPTLSAHLHPAGSGVCLLERSARCRSGRISAAARVDRRSVREPGCGGTFPPRKRLSAQFPLQRQQGVGRSSGTGVGKDLRPAGGGQQLLEQLWSLPVSRETHSPGHRQRPFGKPIPVYGRGENIRDWLFVEDHASALLTILEKGVRGETYLIGGNCERTNIDLVRTLCRLVDEKVKAPSPRESLITYVTDRPGHDIRYAIDATETRQKLGWAPSETLETGLRKTVEWYLANQDWWRRILAGTYDGRRLGAGR